MDAVAPTYQLGYTVHPPPDDGSSASAADYQSPALAGHDWLTRYGITPSTDEDQTAARAADVIATSFQAARYTQSAGGNDLALSDAIDARNQSIFQQTGEKLDNPMAGGYAAEADVRAAQDTTAPDPYDTSVGPALQMQQYRLDAYNEALATLQRKHASIPGLSASILAARNATIAGAEQDQARAVAANGGSLASFPATMIGGLGAAARDPLQLAALAIPVGGELRAASTFGRVVEGALRAGGVNAGIQVVQEPALQRNRADRGVDSGLGPALGDIGEAAAFGGVFGAGHSLISGLLKAHGVPAATGHAAIAGDPEAVAAVAAAVPRATAPVLHATSLGEAMDRAVMEHRPGAADPEQLAGAVREAVRYGEGLGPLPELVASRADPKPAEAMVGKAKSLADAVDALRMDPAARDGALASQYPQTLAIGRLASLSDEAAQMLQEGVVPPEAAAHIPAMFPDPLDHAPAMDALAAEGATTEAAARDVLTVEALVKSHPEAVAALLGDRPPEPQIMPIEKARTGTPIRLRLYRGSNLDIDPLTILRDHADQTRDMGLWMTASRLRAEGYSQSKMFPGMPRGYSLADEGRLHADWVDAIRRDRGEPPLTPAERAAMTRSEAIDAVRRPTLHAATVTLSNPLVVDARKNRPWPGFNPDTDTVESAALAGGHDAIIYNHNADGSDLAGDNSASNIVLLKDGLVEQSESRRLNADQQAVLDANRIRRGLDAVAERAKGRNDLALTASLDRDADIYHRAPEPEQTPEPPAAPEPAAAQVALSAPSVPSADLLDRVPLADRADGGDVAFAHPADMAAALAPEDHMARVIEECPF